VTDWNLEVCLSSKMSVEPCCFFHRSVEDHTIAVDHARKSGFVTILQHLMLDELPPLLGIGSLQELVAGAGNVIAFGGAQSSSRASTSRFVGNEQSRVGLAARPFAPSSCRCFGGFVAMRIEPRFAGGTFLGDRNKLGDC
jgi:hypothetical protein